MEEKPLVSILIPCYNAKATIDATLQSALNQTYDFVEIVINDDCSTDGTYLYLKENYQKHPSIRISQNAQNLGMCGNWNVLFAKAKGTYWIKLDADDLLAPNFIAETIKIALAHDADFIGTSYEFLDVKKNETSAVYTHQNRRSGLLENSLAEIFTNYPFHLCFTLLKASFVKEISPNYYFMETEVGDAEFQIRAASHKNFSAYFLADKMGYYCFHGNNSSLTPLKQSKSFVFDVLAIHHHYLKKQLGSTYTDKIKANFKLYLKEMILRRTPWDLGLLKQTFKYAFL